MPKKIPPHIIEKAIQLRVEKNMTVPEIAERLKHSKGTVNKWLKDYPLQPRDKCRVWKIIENRFTVRKCQNNTIILSQQKN